MESKQQLFERDLHEVAQGIKEKGMEVNFDENGKEIVREILKEKINAAVPVVASNPVVTSSAKVNQPVGGALPDYLEKESPEIKNKIEKLIMLAFNSGIDEAIKQAGLAGPFVLDALHDALTSKLYSELKRRQLLK